MLEPSPFDIALVGWAGRFPGADDVAQLWANLLAGAESLTTLDDARLAELGVAPEQVRRGAYVPRFAALANAESFDAELFGVTPREAELLDPQHRVFLEEAWTALEDAGYLGSPSATVGVYAGASPSTYRDLLLERGLAGRGDAALALGSELDYLATRVSFKLDLRGPSVSVTTACSTSLVAVHLACQGLRDHECDVALAGGVTISPPLDEGYALVRSGVQSRDGVTRSFDADGDGTVFGHGAGIVVLRRLEDAVADHDTIHAVIRGSALSNDGARKASFSAPGVDGQRDAIVAALEMAEVDPATVGYVETHGTATPIGDPIEVTALAEAFRGPTMPARSCAIGSLKPNIGHLDAAAGIAGLIKAALCVEHGEIPPTINFRRPNPAIPFEESPFFVADRRCGWPRPGGPRRACVSSFGFGGTNAHCVLQEPPTPGGERTSDAAAGPELLLLSAQTPEALAQLRTRYAQRLAQLVHAWADVAYTTRVGRRALPHRCAIVASSAQEAVEQLADAPPAVVARVAPTVLLHIGDDVPDAELVAALERTEPAFRAALRACEEAFRVAGGADPTGFSVTYALACALTARGLPRHAIDGSGAGRHAARVLAGAATVERAAAAILAGEPADAAADPSAPTAERDGRIVVACGAEECAAPIASTADVVVALPLRGNAATGHAAFLSALGRLWALGCPVAWEEPERRLRRVPLPTYPFQRRRSWLLDAGPTASARRPTASSPRRESVSAWLQVPAWTRDAAAVGSVAPSREATIVLGGEDPLSAALVAACRRTAGEVLALAPSPDVAADVREAIGRCAGSVARVIALWPAVDDDTAPERRAALDFEAPLAVVRALAQAQGGAPVRLDLVSAGVFAVTGAERLHPERALIVGPARVVGREHPSIACRHYDLDPAELHDPAHVAWIAAALAEGRGRATSDASVAYRGRQVWTQALAHVPTPEPAADGPAADGAVHVITGGWGGVGRALATRLARAGTTLVLLGRSLPEDEAELGAEDRAALVALRALGATVELRRADAADAEAMARVLGGVVAAHGSIASIVHAAGVPGGGLIRTLAADDAADTFRPKLDGSRVAIELAERFAVESVVLFSSVSTLVGRPGTVDYTAANAVLDARAAASTGTAGPRVVSIAWGAWDGLGMNARQDARAIAALTDGAEATGERALTAEEGAEAFHRALALRVPQVVAALGLSSSSLVEAGATGMRDADADAGAVSAADAIGGIAEIWRRLLGIEAIAPDDDFFDLGGDSLLAIAMLNEVEQLGAGTASLGDFLTAPTITQLAGALRTAAPATAHGISEEA